MSADELKKFIDPLDKLARRREPSQAGQESEAWLDARADDPAKIAAAATRLVESGIPEQLVRSFPADQVILLDEERECEVRFDELAKIMGFPAWQFEALAEKAQAVTAEPAIFADALLPGQYNVRRVAGAARAADRPAAARRGAANVRGRARRRLPREAADISPCRCPTTRSPASRSVMKQAARPRTCAARRPRPRKRTPSTACTTKSRSRVIIR